MYKPTPETLASDIEAAEKFRDVHIKHVHEMVCEYVGPAYRGDDASWSENHSYEFIRLTTARTVEDNPRVKVKTRRPATQKPVALAMQHGTNRVVRDTKLQRALVQLYVHQSFAYGVAQIVVQPQPWMDPKTGKAYQWPMVYVVPPERYFFDPLAASEDGARFRGHKWVRDADDLLDEAADPDSGWDADAIRKAGVDQGTESLPERTGERANVPKRGEIVGYEVWVPEYELPEAQTMPHFHGTLFTIAFGEGGRGARWLRKPRPYWGHRRGPYVLFGVYPVPGDPYPLAPLAATYMQQKQLNEIVNAANDAIVNYKRVIICSSDNPKLAKAIKDTPDLYVIEVQGFEQNQVVVVEQGGITEQHVVQIKQALDRLDRATGTFKTERGQVGSRSTATEIAVAESASKDSSAFVEREFKDNTTEVLENIAWFLYHDDRIRFPLGEEAGVALDMGEPWFQGGVAPDSETSFEDLELEIEPYSMGRMNEAVARAQYREMIELLIAAAPVIPMAPFYNWDVIFEKGGDVSNDPYFADVYNRQVAQMMQMAQQQQQQLMYGPPNTGGSPQSANPGRTFPGVMRAQAGQVR
jgi:hypothetical protein